MLIHSTSVLRRIPTFKDNRTMFKYIDTMCLYTAPLCLEKFLRLNTKTRCLNTLTRCVYTKGECKEDCVNSHLQDPLSLIVLPHQTHRSLGIIVLPIFTFSGNHIKISSVGSFLAGLCFSIPSYVAFVGS